MRYLVLQYGQENDRMILRELTDLPNVDTVVWHKEYASLFKRGMRKIHTNSKLNSMFSVPGRDLWHKDVLEATGQVDCLIILAYCLMEIEESFLYKMRKNNPHLKIVLLLWDSMATHSTMMESVRNKILEYKWDMVVSFDRDDCVEYGFVWLGLHYYSPADVSIPATVSSDIFFAGAATEGRKELLEKICQYIKIDGGKCDFKLVLSENWLKRIKGRILKEEPRYSPVGVCMTKRNLSYKEILSSVVHSNCILELVQPGQRMQTLRYFEAVVYNKKLLTNNLYIKELPFYDERYMRVFNSIEDIDVEWLQRREMIDYGYNGEFSPTHILKIIEENIKA